MRIEVRLLVRAWRARPAPHFDRDLLSDIAGLNRHGRGTHPHGLHLTERGHFGDGGVGTAPAHRGAVDYLITTVERDRREGITLADEHDVLCRTDLQVRHLLRLRRRGNGLAWPLAYSLDEAIERAALATRAIPVRGGAHRPPGRSRGACEAVRLSGAERRRQYHNHGDGQSAAEYGLEPRHTRTAPQ